MRLRTLILFAIALLLAGGTATLVRSWLSQRLRQMRHRRRLREPPHRHRSLST